MIMLCKISGKKVKKLVFFGAFHILIGKSYCFLCVTKNKNVFVMSEKEEKTIESGAEPIEVTDVEVHGEAEPTDKSEGGGGDKPLDYKMRFLKRGRKRFQGEYGNDDEELDDNRFAEMMNRLADDDDDRDGRYDKLVDGNKKLFDIFQRDPDSFAVFELLKNNVPLPIALRKVYKDDAYLTMDEDSDDYKRYKDEKESERKKKEEFEKNTSEFENSRAEFYKEAEMTDDEIKSFEDAERAFYEGMAAGKFDKEYFKRINKALNYDKDVKDSYAQGNADGKNSKIKEYVKRTVGDGLPDPDGVGGGLNKGDDEPLDPRIAMFRGIANKSNETKWK